MFAGILIDIRHSRCLLMNLDREDTAADDDCTAISVSSKVFLTIHRYIHICCRLFASLKPVRCINEPLICIRSNITTNMLVSNGDQ